MDQGRVAKRRRRRWMSQNNRLLIPNQDTVPSFGTVSADSSDSALFNGYTPNVAVVGPISRRLYFGKTGGTWKTLWTDTTGALLRGDELGTYAVTKASDGPAPFDTDDGLATDTHSGSVAAGTTFTHEADALIEFTVTTLPVGSSSDLRIRQASAGNYWRIAWNQSGDFSLLEYSGGSLLGARANAAAAISAGNRVVVVTDGTTIKGYSNNTLRWSYASATNFTTATQGDLATPGISGAVSDLYTWPRTLSGTAASILNKVSA